MEALNESRKKETQERKQKEKLERTISFVNVKLIGGKIHVGKKRKSGILF
jgi:hypothetical protein